MPEAHRGPHSTGAASSLLVAATPASSCTESSTVSRTGSAPELLLGRASHGSRSSSDSSSEPSRKCNLLESGGCSSPGCRRSIANVISLAASYAAPYIRLPQSLGFNSDGTQRTHSFMLRSRHHAFILLICTSNEKSLARLRPTASVTAMLSHKLSTRTSRPIWNWAKRLTPRSRALASRRKIPSWNWKAPYLTSFQELAASRPAGTSGKSSTCSHRSRRRARASSTTV